MLDAGDYPSERAMLRNKYEHDPVTRDERGWWFWDETWAFAHGPFATEDEVDEKLQAYADSF